MKILYKEGDCLDGPEQWILHGCNAQGVMGSGVAKAIRNKYPSAYDVYYTNYCQYGLELGDVSSATQRDGKIIFNGITQLDYGKSGLQYVSYQAVADVIKEMTRQVINWNKYRPDDKIYVAMPKIGAGLGGGDWNIISDIIEVYSANFTPVVYTLPAQINKEVICG